MIIIDNLIDIIFMDKNPLISICILNHNWENRLPKAIPSILSQNYNNLEILFLDNWSTDKSLEYISQFKEIKVIKSDVNLWTSWWRNKLAKLAKWEYILFIDNDVELIDNNFISQILSDYKSLRKENIWVIFPIVRLFGNDATCEVWLYYNKLQNTKFVDVYKKWYLKKPWFLWTIFFMDKKIFFDLWCFDEKYPYNMDDQDFSMRMYNMWYSIFVDTNLYVIHHGVEMRTTAEGIWWRYQYYFCGLMRAVLKNYSRKNIMKWGFLISWWAFFKAGKFSIKYRSMLPLKWFFVSVKYFFRDLSDTLILRKIYQKQRIMYEDLFLAME